MSCQRDKADSKTSDHKNDSVSLYVSAVNSKTEYVEKDGRKIAYRKTGQGPAMILCNRFRGIMDDWDPLFIDSLSQYHTVYLFDYSGVGLSTLPNANDSLMEIKDVADLSESLQLNRFILVGWSHGGKVAQTFATHHPAKVSHLILIGTVPLGKNAFPSEKIFFDYALKEVNDLNDEVVLFFEPADSGSVAAAKASRGRIDQRTDKDIYVKPDVFKKYFATNAAFVADEQGRTKLATLPIPILSLSGDHDIVFPIENWYALTRVYPNLQIIMLPRAGHGPQQQYPLLSARYVGDFIKNTN
ncbi:alpha/beta hydrolase [Chryseolinea sp. Jin1]|uniref:Alpha/beta hydrolase n=2 Tax=Chryseolinea lacunae TaxID=2801331 RepID=A0ABS1KL96_9BACT|nr:alpha/beta hydrolase [Chryseolinea lacunae]